MSRLYNYFLVSWVNGTVTQEQIQNAVAKGYLTQDESNTILATPQA